MLAEALTSCAVLPIAKNMVINKKPNISAKGNQGVSQNAGLIIV
jgi:hypothetical protein